MKEKMTQLSKQMLEKIEEFKKEANLTREVKPYSSRVDCLKGDYYLTEYDLPKYGKVVRIDYALEDNALVNFFSFYS